MKRGGAEPAFCFFVCFRWVCSPDFLPPPRPHPTTTPPTHPHITIDEVYGSYVFRSAAATDYLLASYREVQLVSSNLITLEIVLWSAPDKLEDCTVLQINQDAPPQ